MVNLAIFEIITIKINILLIILKIISTKKNRKFLNIGSFVNYEKWYYAKNDSQSRKKQLGYCCNCF